MVSVSQLDFHIYASDIGALRYKVFVEQFGWVVGDTATGLELDALDNNATHIGVRDSSGDLVGYVRIIQGGQGALLLEQPAFESLWQNTLCVDASTCEVSRLCVKPGRGTDDEPTDDQVVQALIRAVYDFCSQRQIATVYATTNDVPSGHVRRATLEQLMFVVVTGPVQFEANINTYLMSCDVAQAVATPHVRRYLNL